MVVEERGSVEEFQGARSRLKSILHPTYFILEQTLYKKANELDEKPWQVVGEALSCYSPCLAIVTYRITPQSIALLCDRPRSAGYYPALPCPFPQTPSHNRHHRFDLHF
jgi:hypothetical protein